MFDRRYVVTTTVKNSPTRRRAAIFMPDTCSAHAPRRYRETGRSRASRCRSPREEAHDGDWRRARQGQDRGRFASSSVSPARRSREAAGAGHLSGRASRDVWPSPLPAMISSRSACLAAVVRSPQRIAASGRPPRPDARRTTHTARRRAPCRGAASRGRRQRLGIVLARSSLLLEASFRLCDEHLG